MTPEPPPPPGRSAALFAAFLAAIVLLRGDALDQPPVWDTASGLFPAAIVLAENGFDLADLLSRPGWAHGGPNIHQFSSVTWATALVLWLVPEREVWLPLLHALHFALAAWLLVSVVRLGRRLLPAPLALATAGALLLFPLFQVQAGYLYTEIPLALCTVRALLAAAERRQLHAALWSALACSVKEAGLVVPAALAAAALLERGPPGPRLARAAGFALPGGLAVALQVGFALPVEADFGVRPLPWGEQLLDALRKLRMLPDLALLLAVFGAGAAWSLPAALRALRAPSPRAPDPDRVRGLALLLAGAFAGFYLLVPLVGVEVYVLPRYYVQLAPVVLLGVSDLALRAAGPRAAAAALAGLALLFVANRNGALPVYPPVPGNELSLAERSLEYRELLAVQRRLVEAAAELPAELPVFYGLQEHFFFQYPRMGYAEAPLPNGRCIWLEPRYRRARLSEFPERFAILYDFVGYGGLQLQRLMRQARADPAWDVRVTAFERGRYRTLLARVERVGPGAP